MAEELIKQDAGLAIESVIAKGDLANLTPQERVNYYRSVCTSLGLNPLTQPFGYITLSGRLTLYAKRDAADQLRRLHGITFPDKPDISYADDIVSVVSHARDRDGRDDYDIGAVSIAGLKGNDRANAVMKAITKSKRRVTLSLVGLGWLDETEIETAPDAAPAIVTETGEIVAPPNGNPQPAPNPVGGKMMWKGDALPAEPPEPTKPNGHTPPPPRPWDPEWLKAAADTKVKAYKAKVKDTEGQARYAIACLDKLTLSDAQDRHGITLYLFGKEHLAELSEAERAFCIDWSGCKEPDYEPNPTSIEEAKRVLRAWIEAQGQTVMNLSEEMEKALHAPAE